MFYCSLLEGKKVKKIKLVEDDYPLVEKREKRVQHKGRWYIFMAWIHPRGGGDDYQMKIELFALSYTHAVESLINRLRTISDVTNDWEHIKIEEV